MSDAFSDAAGPPTAQGELERLHASIDAGFLLPTRWYSDPAIFRAELERIHHRAWHFATHAGDLGGLDRTLDSDASAVG
jgi:hypothetical protein